ncbi:MAG TPA: hypothetical protein VK745_31625 [Polyangiaceae bacterium]|nr:hypothetical protein [Polyangiaceae bacterium]
MKVANGLGVGGEQRREPSVYRKARDQQDACGREEPTQHEDCPRTSRGERAEGGSEVSEVIVPPPLWLMLWERAAADRSTAWLVVAHDIDCFRHCPQLLDHSMVTD